jgi:hypothetical protein
MIGARKLGMQAITAANRGLTKAGVCIAPAKLFSDEWLRYVRYFCHLLYLVREVPGAIVECGVASGNSLAILAALNRSEPYPRRIYGYDSWRGLPEPAEHELRGQNREPHAGQFASDMSMVYARLAQWRLGPGAVSLIPGRLEHTLPACDVGQIALLHVDVDLYASYLVVLENLWDRVQPGGVVAYDEYRDPPYPGATRAIDEFLGRVPNGRASLRKSPFNDRWYSIHM